jgi:hypothetical protein
MLAKRNDDSLYVKGRIGDRPCLMTIDTGASITIARPDITAGLPETKPSWLYVLQMVSGKTLPVLKEVLVELTLRQSTMHLGVCHEDHR